MTPIEAELQFLATSGIALGILGSLGDIVGQKQSKEETPQQPQPTCSTACCSSPGSPGCSSLWRLSRDRLASQLQIALATRKHNKTCKAVKTILSSGTSKLFRARTLNKPSLLPKKQWAWLSSPISRFYIILTHVNSISLKGVHSLFPCACLHTVSVFR
jgi:hypothetical protein